MANRKPVPWNSYECTGYDNVADKFVACMKHEGSHSITSEDCDNLLSLQSAHATLSAENAMLREELKHLISIFGCQNAVDPGDDLSGDCKACSVCIARAALAKGGA